MSSARGGRVRRWSVVVGLVLLVGACAPAPSPEDQLAEMIRFVEVSRGHDFLTDPVVEFLDDADFRADYLARLSAAQPDLEVAEAAFVALDWLAPTADLFEAYRRLGGDAVVGFYEPGTGELKVRGSSLTPYRREVIVHELTHALDDQVHDISEEFGDGFLGEQTFAALVAIEGSAERVRQAWFRSRSAIEQLQSYQEQLSAGVEPDLLTVPIALITFTQAPYLRGVTLAEQATGAAGTPGGIDQLLSRYPATAEQAFDYGKYVAGEAAAAVPLPPAEGAVVASGSWGQFLLGSILRDGLVLDQVDPVTRPWAGDAYVTWEDGSTRCFRLDTAMDTQPAADVLEAQLVAWTTRHTGGTVEDLGGGLIRFTACR